jgi:uncharacterized FlgJ-related protein
MQLFKYSKQNLTYVSATKQLVILIAFICLLTSMVTIGYIKFSQKVTANYITEELKLIILNEEHKFTEDKFKEYLFSLNLKYPYIVLAQAKLESNNFQSKIFIENHNMFGMKAAKQRPTTNKGEQYNHGYFDNWKDCVIDYALYQAKYLSDIKSETDYYNYLKQYYAEDSAYVPKLIKIVNNQQLKKLIKI